LVAATVLAGIRMGLQQQMDAGAAVTGNGYDQPGAHPEMPRDWRGAIAATEASDFVKTALGADLHRAFVAIKWAEYARMARTVSAMDYDLYLTRV
jgi:glutamine synthetase